MRRYGENNRTLEGRVKGEDNSDLRGGIERREKGINA